MVARLTSREIDGKKSQNMFSCGGCGIEAVEFGD